MLAYLNHSALKTRVENVPHVNWDVVVDTWHHCAGMQHLSTEIRQLHRLIVSIC
jgi:hypothetical protein